MRHYISYQKKQYLTVFNKKFQLIQVKKIFFKKELNNFKFCFSFYVHKQAVILRMLMYKHFQIQVNYIERGSLT